MQKYNYLITIEKTPNNYSAYSPDLLGCIATGITIQEVKNNMLEARGIPLQGL
jgi:predicted RNase H-like HicB family nuclease